MALKKYDTATKIQKQGSIPSGVKSGDNTENELMIIAPLIEHPELKGMYRAIDNETGWLGWVKYTPPVVEVPVVTPSVQESKLNEYEGKMGDLRRKLSLVDAGVIEESDTNIDSLRKELKTLASDLGYI